MTFTRISAVFFSTFFFLWLATRLTPEYSPPPLEAPAPTVTHGESEKVTDEQRTLIRYLADKYDRSEQLVRKIVLTAYSQADELGLSPLLILAVIEKESSLRPQVVNSYGAVGLMQVVPRWHPEKLESTDHVAELQEPETNIRVGAKILKQYLQAKNGDLQAALKKYSGNAQDYAEKVSHFRQELKDVISSSHP